MRELADGRTVELTDRYSMVFSVGRDVLLFTWHEVGELAVEEYKDAIRAIAARAVALKPSVLVIDRRQFRANVAFDMYPWWSREILPMYHQAGIARFAHITGDPDAAGQYAEALEGVEFEMGEFTDLQQAVDWAVA
ncbi:MAG: hypothetical protein ACRDNB_01310 [Gaiellaceae bacterium]